MFWNVLWRKGSRRRTQPPHQAWAVNYEPNSPFRLHGCLRHEHNVAVTRCIKQKKKANLSQGFPRHSQECAGQNHSWYMRKEATEVKNTNQVLFETQGPREFKGRALGQSNRRQTEVGIWSSPTSWRALSWKTNPGQQVLQVWFKCWRVWKEEWITSCYYHALLAWPAPFDRMPFYFCVFGFFSS